MIEVMFRKEKGQFSATHHYEPFGVELEPFGNNTTDNKYRFTGQERDTHTNFDYMHFRFYASSMGRFLKPDNIIGNMANPQSWNLYSYVNGNPVNFNDPGGHEPPNSEQQVSQTAGGSSMVYAGTTASDENQERRRKLEQPKKVGDELKEPVPTEVEAAAKEVQALQKETGKEWSVMVAYDAQGNVYKSNMHEGKNLSPKEKTEGKIEGKSSLKGPALDLQNIQNETGVIFTKVYAIHSHPSDTSPSYPADYTALSEAKGSVAAYKMIGVVATPKQMFIYDERKYRAIPYSN